MKYLTLNIPEVIEIQPEIFEDERGFFLETFNQEKFNKAIGREVFFVQDNHSKSKYRVLRGLHYQESPFEQAKLVRVISGEIFDVALDIRADSKSYGKWVGCVLSDQNKKQLWIPEGFAHGFLVTSEYAEVIYKTNNFYNQKYEKTIHWKNNDFKIDWPEINIDVVTSKKDS